MRATLGCRVRTSWSVDPDGTPREHIELAAEPQTKLRPEHLPMIEPRAEREYRTGSYLFFLPAS